MKAAFIETTGSREVIRYGDMPHPQPGSDEDFLYHHIIAQP